MGRGENQILLQNQNLLARRNTKQQSSTGLNEITDDIKWRKLIVDKRVAACSTDDYRFEMLLEDDSKVVISPSAISYGHGQTGMKLTIANVKGTPKNKSLKIPTQPENLVSINPHLITESEYIDKQELSSVLTNQRIVSASSLKTYGGYETDSVKIGLSDGTFLEVNASLINYGHGDMSSGIRITRTKNVNHWEMEYQRITKMSKTKLLKNVDSIKQLIKDGTERDNQRLTVSLMNTITKNTKPENIVKRYAKLITLLPDYACSNWSRKHNQPESHSLDEKPYGLTNQQKEQVKAYIRSADCKLNPRLKSELRKRLIY